MKKTQPVMVPIEKIEDVAKDIKTFYFKMDMKGEPGQFFLLWFPGLDEKPFGIASQKDGVFSATISMVGRFTQQIFGLIKGDKVGIRGPFGKSFSQKGENVALVAGGYGIGPLSFLADVLVKKGKKVHMITGAKTKDRLIICDKEKQVCEFLYATDDGTFGEKGYATNMLEKLIEKEDIDMIYTVGPETMMKKVVEISDEHYIDCELSLERYMKCGIGVCGQCCVDDTGERMCKEGPVITKEHAKQIKEFGEYKRDKTGKKV